MTHIIFPLLSLYHTDAGAVPKEPPRARFFLCQPPYLIFNFLFRKKRFMILTKLFSPLFYIYQPAAGGALTPPPGAVFLLSLPDYCFFIFIEKQ